MNAIPTSARTGTAIRIQIQRRSVLVGCSSRRNVPSPCAQATSITARPAVITHVRISASPKSRNAIAFSGNSASRIATIAAT